MRAQTHVDDLLLQSPHSIVPDALGRRMFIQPRGVTQFPHEEVHCAIAIEIRDDQGVRIKQVIAQYFHMPMRGDVFAGPAARNPPVTAASLLRPVNGGVSFRQDDFRPAIRCEAGDCHARRQETLGVGIALPVAVRM